MRLFEGTEFDRPPRCERCDQLEAECRCPPPEPVRIPPEKQTARLAIESRKNGKRVTVIRGLSAVDNDLPGGTLTGDDIEIQGEHLDRLRSLLQGIGYRVK